jgi:hypothetical protein
MLLSACFLPVGEGSADGAVEPGLALRRGWFEESPRRLALAWVWATRWELHLPRRNPALAPLLVTPVVSEMC